MEMDKIEKLKTFGILLLDKPAGPTSFSVSDYVREKLDLKKTSHFGTLDPAVTGVLPIALGRGCKLTGFFLGHDKTYIGILHTHKEQNLKDLQEIINKNFIGKIKQLPPKKSRVKREIREREIKRFELIEQDGKDFLFVAEVQGGTYIRKLCSDLGEMIGGAHMAELRRVRAGIFSENEKQFVNLYDFEKAIEEYKKGNSKELEKMIVPAEEAIKKIFSVVETDKESIKHLMTGKFLFKESIKKTPKEKVFAVFHKKNFVGIYEKIEKNPKVIARPLFVYN